MIRLAEGKKAFLLGAEERPGADSMAQAYEKGEVVHRSLESASVGL